jgi:hypothetical protein
VVVFCGGWTPPSGPIHLNPGLYVIWGGTFGCNGCQITGSDVTIFLTGTGTNYATMQFAGSGSLVISAPTDAYVQGNPGFMGVEGIAISADRNAPCDNTSCANSSFSGNAFATVTGVIYTPHQTVTFNGNGAGGAPGCSQIISFQLTFHGNSGFQNNCTDYQNTATGQGVVNIGAIPAQLIE